MKYRIIGHNTNGEQWERIANGNKQYFAIYRELMNNPAAVVDAEQIIEPKHKRESLFDKIYKKTAEIEGKHNMPLFINGIFFNTNDGILDAEGIGENGTGDLIYNQSQLVDFLHDNGTTAKEMNEILKLVVIEDEEEE